MNERKLRWKPTTLPSNDFVNKGTGLFPCKNAERKTHEIRVSY
jgi:hypothetical protein